MGSWGGAGEGAIGGAETGSAFGPWGTAIGGVLGGIGGFFGGGGDKGSSKPQYTSDQLIGKASPYLDPYFQAGKAELPGLEQQYGQLTNDPGGRLNQIGQSFHQSPGFNFAMQNAMQGQGHAAAAGGLAGSPEAQQLAQQKATGMANQDYYHWLGNATNMYGQGLQGEQHLAGMGQQAGESMADLISQSMTNQNDMGYMSNLERQQAAAKNQGQMGSDLSDLGRQFRGSDFYRNHNMGSF